MPIQCESWWGHKYQPRYSEAEHDSALAKRIAADSFVEFSYTSKDLRLKGGDYLGDICVRCGDFVPRPK